MIEDVKHVKREKESGREDVDDGEEEYKWKQRSDPATWKRRCREEFRGKTKRKKMKGEKRGAGRRDDAPLNALALSRAAGSRRLAAAFCAGGNGVGGSSSKSLLGV